MSWTEAAAVGLALAWLLLFTAIVVLERRDTRQLRKAVERMTEASNWTHWADEEKSA
jgi:hypothetical protein